MESSFSFLDGYETVFGLNPAEAFQSAKALESGGFVRFPDYLQEALRYAFSFAGEACASVLFLLAAALLSVLMPKGDGALRKYAGFLFLGVCAYPAVSDFFAAAVLAKEGISELTALMLASVPVLMSLRLTTASGVFLFITQLTGSLMLSVFLPLILFRTALGVCDGVTDLFSLSGIREMLKGIFTWGLGAVMLVFSMTSAFSGAVAGSKASIAGRSLRYAGNLVPVVGRYLSESAEMIYASASVLIQAGGIGIGAAILSCVMLPFLRLLVYVFLYKMAAFFVKPVAPPSLTALLDAVGEGFSGLAGMTVLTASISLINLAVIVRASGGV